MAHPVAYADVLEFVAGAEGGSGEPPPDPVAGDPGDDVRMRGFRRRVSFETALLAALEGHAAPASETVTLDAAAGRILAESVTSDVDVPSFRRAAMDGYAVRAEDTFGASLYDPVRLALVGESMPGGDGAPRLSSRECAGIMTGAPLPEGADAVLPAEHARRTGNDVFAECDVTPGRNVGAVGEDVTRGTRLFVPGRRLRPQDLGLLASIGRGAVTVTRRPRVRIIVTGNELLPVGKRPGGHCIVDSNTPMLRALIERDGGVIEAAHRLADDEAAIRAALAAPGADVIVTAGGTSVGREDHMPQLVRELGELTVHGVAMRPAAPAGIGRIGAAKVFLLPGNPVSCLAAYDLLVSPAIRKLAGAEHPAYATTRHRLRRRIVSQVGRTDYVRVAVLGDDAEPIAVAGASILSSTTRADGFVLVPEESEGLAEGADVTVFRYESCGGAGPGA
jgi:molybdopterin molybdotransferase